METNQRKVEPKLMVTKHEVRKIKALKDCLNLKIQRTPQILHLLSTKLEVVLRQAVKVIDHFWELNRLFKIAKQKFKLSQLITRQKLKISKFLSPGLIMVKAMLIFSFPGLAGKGWRDTHLNPWTVVL